MAFKLATYKMPILGALYFIKFVFYLSSLAKRKIRARVKYNESKTKQNTMIRFQLFPSLRADAHTNERKFLLNLLHI